MAPPVLVADPCGLIRSYVNNPPRGRISPNDVFLLWRISHASGSNLEAARAVIGAYGKSMSQSNSKWLDRLLWLCHEITEPQSTLPHSDSYSSSAPIKRSKTLKVKK